MISGKLITVLLAEDHTVVREGLRILLGSEADINVVGEAATGFQAVEMAKRLHPAVVVMDIAMPMLNGLEATRQIVRDVPGVKVLILSAHGDIAYVEQATALGASGYLLKQTSASDLSVAIREVHKGNTFFSPAIARGSVDKGQTLLDRKGLLKTKGDLLSPREMQVLQLVAEGKANKQIASALGLSIKTVEKHRDRLMKKLRLHDIAGLTRYAIGAGVIESSVQVTIVEEPGLAGEPSQSEGRDLPAQRGGPKPHRGTRRSKNGPKG